MENGILAGYPMTGIHVRSVRRFVPRSGLQRNGVQDRRFDGASRTAPRRPAPILLEPIMDVEVVVPEAYMGAVVGDLNSRRGKINGMVPRGELQVIAVSVPLSEMFGYANTLRNISQGRAVFYDGVREVRAGPGGSVQEDVGKSRFVIS